MRALLRRVRLALALMATAVALAACASSWAPPGPAVTTPSLGAEAGHVRMADGAHLPLRVWLPPDGVAVQATVVAVHGFNDYSNAFAEVGPFLAERGVAVYAYDQRGFGNAPNRGLWAGSEGLAGDLLTVARLVERRHPDVPLYVLGESMGGAVAMVAATSAAAPPMDGLVLSAPAVWARDTMPAYQRLGLWFAARLVPWMTVTGRGLDIMPSDNVEMLRALSADPTVIKETRVDTIEGLVDLMDAALAAAPRLHLPVLVLYGENDEIIPPEPTYRMIANLPDNPAPQRIAIYPEGWHMLMRDLQAEVVLNDIASWIKHRQRPLPSGADVNARQVLAEEGIRLPPLPLRQAAPAE